jgi:hypothetical protein
MTPKEFYIDLAGFVVKVQFKITPLEYQLGLLTRDIKTIWGQGKFLKNKSKTPDLTITFIEPQNKLTVITSKDRREKYHLIYRFFPKQKSVQVYEPISIYQFNILLREALINLIKKDGFVMHSSGSISKRGIVSLFLTQSGGGKSTTRSLFMKGSGDSFFCDDSVIVRKIDSKWHFFSPPFIEKEFLPTIRLSRRAFLYFVKKSKIPRVSNFKNDTLAMKTILENLWVSETGFDKKILKRVKGFVNSNRIYQLNNSLDYKKLTSAIRASQVNIKGFDKGGNKSAGE